MEEMIGVIKLFAGNFAPNGYSFCNGQLLSIAQNTALFSILGTTYGGDGRATFALPDLRSRVPVGTGQGPGLSDVQLGEIGGSETATVTPSPTMTAQATPIEDAQFETIPIRNPYLGMNYIICLQGVFPSRS